MGTLERCYVHQSTFGRNRLSMAAGLATLRIIERDRLVEHAAHMGAVLRDGLAELQQRYEMIKEVRGSGLMIGIELGAPSSRVARLNWRLIHMASEGLFPQLIVIPLHRDHGVITMAAGKNDVIKLLPPLTLSEAEARSFLGALDAVLAECHGAASKNWAVVRDIATATLRRRATHDATRASSATPFRGKPVDPSRERRLPGHGRDRVHRRAPGAAPGAGGLSGALPRAREQRHLAARRARRRDRRRRPHERAFARARRRGLPTTCSTAARSCRTGPRREEITRTNVDGHAESARGLRRRIGAALRPFQHHGRLRLSRRRGDRRDVHGRRGFGTGTRRRSWTPRPRSAASKRRTRSTRSSCARRPSTDPARRMSSARSRARSAARNMLLVDGGRAVAGLCYVENLIDAAVLALRHDAAPGHAFNVSDGLDVTWKEFTDGLAEGLGCSQVRWSLPYWLANGDRLLARARLPTAAQDHRSERAAAALAPGRAGAGQRPGLQQSQGARAARLGAARRLCDRPRGDARLARSYIANSTNPDGVRAQEVVQSLAADVAEELGHAQLFAKRIKELYGTVPGSKDFQASQEALQPPSDSLDLVHVVRGVIEAERGAIGHYTNLIQATDGVDPVTQDLVTTILADEQNHLRTFEGFLREFERDR